MYYHMVIPLEIMMDVYAILTIATMMTMILTENQYEWCMLTFFHQAGYHLENIRRYVAHWEDNPQQLVMIIPHAVPLSLSILFIVKEEQSQTYKMSVSVS